jgi:phosphoenolpyruvate carboxylase
VVPEGGGPSLQVSDPEGVPAALRRDVGYLGRLLGRVLVESEGSDLLNDVERLRLASIEFRKEPTEARRRGITEMVSALDVERAALVARSFTIYFHLVNLAEERHRVRALREQARGPEPVPESIEAAVAEIRSREGNDALRRELERLSITPVVTAHPTEARRRSVVDALRRIAGLLATQEQAGASRPAGAHVERRLLEEITLLWRTDQIRSRRPGPLDEVRTAMVVFDETIFRAVTQLYRELDRALGPGDVGAREPASSAFVRWGSWVGADRDGNPEVTAEVTRATAAIQADHVLRGLEAVARRIASALTASTASTPASRELLVSLARDERRFPDVAASLRERFEDQPHRRKLVLVAERLSATRRHKPAGYEGPDELLRDVARVQGSLDAAGAPRAAFGELQHLRWQVETFGFHLASLEVRQHSAVHARVVAELMGDDAQPTSTADLAALDRLAREGWPEAAGPSSEEAAEVIETFGAMAEIQRRYGPEACRRYIISFTRSPADVIAVYALARLAVPDGSLQLDVVPLFESRADLAAGQRVLDQLFALPSMADRLEARGREVEVMLGYSDSAKEAGFLAANVALHRAQADLAAWAGTNDVRLTLFHGRGGAAGRGGGPTNRAILSQAAGSVAGRFKVTEQGEMVFARYGDIEIALRHLEQVTSAVLLASTPEGERAARAGEERFAAPMDRMAAASEHAYRELVERPGFVRFFERVTPIVEIEGLQVGSRPARRGERQDVESLRAIPWVFAWTQSRVNLPGWYGLGSGLATIAEESGGIGTLREMHEGSPFFRSLIENAELSLVIADMPIAALYMELGEDPEIAGRIFDEHQRTVELILTVNGNDRLLAERPMLRRAVELRNPYVDALSFIQVRHLADLRKGDLEPEEAARIGRNVLVTVNGIAAGLQTTG